MTALALPARQPFASLDTPTMQPLMRSRLSRQNVQNGIALSAKNSIFMDEDSENIDPSSKSFSAKRKRALDDDEISKGSPKPLKTSRIALTTRDPKASVRSLSTSTPVKTLPSTPKSAPVPRPAGRTPPRTSKTLGRRSAIAKLRPESAKRSVAPALAPPPKPQPKAKASWFFDIYVDSEQEEMTNLLQHSTGVLDISDDEGKGSPADSRGKENVPPAELGIDLPHSAQATSLAAPVVARKAPKMEEDRAPLGELDAADYYPEGCNAFSVALVHEDEHESVPFKKASGLTPFSASTFVPPAITTSIASMLEASMTPKSPEEPSSKESTSDAMEASEEALDSKFN
ncbi:hypothetical protein N7468_007900 [Penicillium chermesinum]|uniref:Uncharacterized protein n=1 Tax=Penicillium chermesinum TaxID=63820 RepID=A0A9W9NR25_9EURO|nr:uncharacterized protein N7468_007900 [Penicillium chermesinum]KAJ5223358.1 hypothetical protein N7468_007900 [Penicillium chermesinum]